MPNNPCFPLSVLIAGLLTLAEAPAEVQYPECLAHFYGSKSRPQIEIEIQDDGAPEDQRRGDLWFNLTMFGANGVGQRASTSFPVDPAGLREADGGLELGGTSRLQGREIRVRAVVSRDRSSLEVTEPKSVLLADGTKLPLAGRYADLSEEIRASRAKAVLDPVDKELNAVYGKLVATLDPAAAEELRADQRLWLNYRDFTIMDSDGPGPDGPGSAPHFRQQARRTLERIAYLRAILSQPPAAGEGSALYSNGRGGTFAVGRIDETVVFSASLRIPKLHSGDPRWGDDLTLGGLAGPAGGNTWLAKPEDILTEDVSNPDEWPVESLRLVFDPSGRLRVEAAGESVPPGPLARVVGGTYHRLEALAPAQEPMRSLLVGLSERAFDDTTEGLESADKKALALTGRGGTFKLEKETADRLILSHHDGRVRLLRLAGADGVVVVAVEQTNGRNLTMQLWRKARAGDALRLWEGALPKPPVEKFFATDLGAGLAKVRDQSAYVYQLHSGQGLDLSLEVRLEKPLPDYHFSLDWDGFGFELEREPLR
jgi:uncharacterized protein YecT (DUF1311 family)